MTEKESDEKEEWVLISDWKDVEYHMAFAKTERFERHGEIVGCVEGLSLDI